jgi:succinate dehydrogenase/fumarate reductase flavoprotein subunit
MSIVSRRKFLEASAASLAALPMGIASAKEIKKDSDVKWDKTADVVVLGYGNAGSNAAIAAHDAGAGVLILEKAKEGGGSVCVSSGGFVVPTNPEDYYTYQKACYEMAGSEWDPEILKVFCEESMKLGDYVKSLDPNVQVAAYGHAGYQNLPGADCVNKMSPRNVPGNKGGERLWGILDRAVQQRKIPVLYETPARRLITRGKEIVGVEALSQGKTISVKANKGVIIATGGFQCNPDLMKRYVFGGPMSYLCGPGHTGDGLIMAQSVGCDLWHMNAVSAPLGIQVPGVQAGLALITRRPSFIWVDQDGKRFVNEKKLDYHCSWMAVHQYDAIEHRYPRMPCYMIMDEAYMKGAPLISSGGSGYAINKEGYVWSKDNSKEIENGVVLKADTIEELAKKLGIRNPKQLVKTVERWNSDLKNEGIDTEFGRAISADPNQKAIFVGRDVKAWSAPIETGPFYAVKLIPVLYHTMGGPRRSVRAEVLNPFNEPIPRLFVAGELGSTWGITYQGACANADAMIFGRIAGREAAKLAGWS